MCSLLEQENGMEVEVESKEIPTSKVHILEGHTSNVKIWNLLYH